MSGVHNIYRMGHWVIGSTVSRIAMCVVRDEKENHALACFIGNSTISSQRGAPGKARPYRDSRRSRFTAASTTILSDFNVPKFIYRGTCICG